VRRLGVGALVHRVGSTKRERGDGECNSFVEEFVGVARRVFDEAVTTPLTRRDRIVTACLRRLRGRRSLGQAVDLRHVIRIDAARPI